MIAVPLENCGGGSNAADLGQKKSGKIIDYQPRSSIAAACRQASVPVGKIMKKDVATLDCSKTALDAAALMIEKGTGCIVVTLQGRPFGMVTEKDILCEIVFSGRVPGEISVGVIASRPLINVSPEEPVGSVADLMTRNSIRRVPVVEGGKIVGMVGAKDLARLMSSARAGKPGPYLQSCAQGGMIL